MIDFKDLESPCFVIHEDDFLTSLRGFRSALAQRFPHYITSYSVKTNSLPWCLKEARAEGYYAEVVSSDEYELALRCGFPKNSIIYNGPMKSRESFLDALELGAHVNIETFREIEWLHELPKHRNYSVGIRMNVNISAISPEDENHENDNSRFGFSVESGDFNRALQLIAKEGNIVVDGLHIHRTSRTRSLQFYKNLIEYALSTLSFLKIKPNYIDIGGGYFGIMPGKPTYIDYAQVFADTIGGYFDLRDITVIIEPGNAIVASCFSFNHTVIDVKRHNGVFYVTTDGSRIDVDPLFHKTDYFKSFHYCDDMKREQVSCQIVSGCTCLEFDRMMELHNSPLLKVGDRISFDRVGAYTMCFTPLFIRYWPAVYVEHEGKFSLVRKRWRASDYMANSIL